MLGARAVVFRPRAASHRLLQASSQTAPHDAPVLAAPPAARGIRAHLQATPMSGRGTLSFSGIGRQITIDADLAHVAAGPFKDATVKGHATTRSPGGLITMSLSAKDGANHADASATARLTPLALTLKRFDGTWSSARFALASPAIFIMENGKFSLKPVTIGVSGGELVVSANGGDGALTAAARLSNVPVAPFATALQLGRARGALGADLVAEMAPGKTQAQLQIRATNLAFAAAGKTAKPANVSLDARWDGTT